MAIKVADVSEYDEVEALLLQAATPDLAMPRLVLYQVVNDQAVVILELLGLSIYAAMQIRGSPQPLDLVLRATYDIAKVLQWLHKKGYVHRDIKPDNILLGRGANTDRAYLIDYAEARKYKRPNTAGQVGSPYFVSLNLLKGGVEGPKDDLEALMTSMTFLLQGNLPWMKTVELDTMRLQLLVMKQKEATSISTLCAGLPPVFATIFQHARDLQGTSLPDYKMIFSSLKSLAKQEGIDLRHSSSLVPELLGRQTSIVSEQPRGRLQPLGKTRRTESVRGLIQTAETHEERKHRQHRSHTTKHRRHPNSDFIPTLKTNSGPHFSPSIQQLLKPPKKFHILGLPVSQP